MQPTAPTATDRCIGVMGRIFAHKFRERYLTKRIPRYNPPQAAMAIGANLGELLKAVMESCKRSKSRSRPRHKQRSKINRP
jgi:hypothetical protein